MASVSNARLRAWSRDAPPCACTASIICVSTRSTGFSVIIGSWKIIAMSRPRSWRQRAGVAPRSSSPLKRMLPSTMRPGSSSRPISEKPVMLLPEPDSPTRPRISPAARCRSTPSTARTTPLRVKKCVFRPRTSSTGPDAAGDLSTRFACIAFP